MGLADGGFRCANAQRHYLAVYDEVRGLSPQPDVVHDVPTTFGNVRVYQHGPDRGVPVVLIHGFFLTSAMWWEQVTGLTNDFTVYAMDMLGQPGASIQSKSMSTPAECARSIDAVLDGLRLRDVDLSDPERPIGEVHFPGQAKRRRERRMPLPAEWTALYQR